jgi:hypothetical protein
MKTLKIISVICAVLIFVSCGKKASFENSIPKDALIVTKLDIKSLVQKADYKLFENPVVKAGLAMLETQFETDAQRKLFANLQKEPNSFGINIIGDSYFFMNSKVAGFLFSVNDAKKISKNLKLSDTFFEEQIEKKDDVYSANLYENGKIMWDNNKFLLLIDYNWRGGNTENFAEYFNLPKEKSVASDKNFQKFMSAKNDISTWYAVSNYSNFMENFYSSYNTYDSEVMQKIYDIYGKLSGVSAFIGCNFEKGAIVTKMQTLYENAEAEKKLSEIYDFQNLKISGELLKYVSPTPPFLFTMDFDGEKILNSVEKLGLTSFLDSAKYKENIDLKALFGLLKGDLVFAVNNVNTLNNDISTSISALVQLGNLNNNPDATAGITALFALLEKKGAVTKQPDGTYATHKGSVFGIKEGIFYFLTDENAKKLFAEGTENHLAEKCKGQPAFVYGDLAELKNALQPLTSQNPYYAPVFDKGLALFQNFESKYIDKYNTEFTVNFNDKNENSLKQIFGFIDTVISNMPLMR